LIASFIFNAAKEINSTIISFTNRMKPHGVVKSDKGFGSKNIVKIVPVRSNVLKLMRANCENNGRKSLTYNRCFFQKTKAKMIPEHQMEAQTRWIKSKPINRRAGSDSKE
jgi:invasion protein IalB